MLNKQAIAPIKYAATQKPAPKEYDGKLCIVITVCMAIIAKHKTMKNII